MKFNKVLFAISLLISVNSFCTEKIAIKDIHKVEVLDALAANEELHSSFFKYKASEVEVNAKKLSEKISKISNKEISKLLAFANTKLSTIKSKSKRADNNEAYHIASMALINVINTYNLGDKYKGYVCPMVKKKWVQNTSKMEKVHNPYAPYMPHCGSKMRQK
jgi:hypothetical protein